LETGEDGAGIAHQEGALDQPTIRGKSCQGLFIAVGLDRRSPKGPVALATGVEQAGTTELLQSGAELRMDGWLLRDVDDLSGDAPLSQPGQSPPTGAAG